MPTVIRRSETVTVTERRSDVFHAVGWQVTSSLWSPPTDVYETEEELLSGLKLPVCGKSISRSHSITGSC